MRLARRWTWAAAVLLCASGAVAALIVSNAAPEVPPISADAASTSPYVIKLHARWCPVCMVTKDVWSEVEAGYAGRVRLLVFDFTTDATTGASRAEARRLGLDEVFEQYAGETGTVLVVHGVSKTVLHVLHGNRDPADYRTAVDSALAATRV